MTLTEKKDLYKAKFPSILADRMASQSNHEDLLDGDNSDIIGTFNIWENTKEGAQFWCDIHDLYSDFESPTHEQILEVFKKFNIQP